MRSIGTRFVKDGEWKSSSSAGSTSWSYSPDGLGRQAGTTQTTLGVDYKITYTYNLIDEVTSMTMPSGRKVTTLYDALGRPFSVSGSYGGVNNSYVTAITYAPQSVATQTALGNGLMEQTCFNDRLQPFVIRQRPIGDVSQCQSNPSPDAFDVAFFSYTFPTGNNGNIAGQTIQYGASGPYPSKTFQQAYTYDGGNRLINVNENSARMQSFGYDAVGNRWLSAGAQLDATTPMANVFNANNQLNATAYDARGNQLQDGGYTFQYDAENRLTSSATGRIFWSGAGAAAAAGRYAEESGGMTLDMTRLGWLLGRLSDAATSVGGNIMPVWRLASGSFAAGAQGSAAFIQGTGLGPTWLDVEQPALIYNGVAILQVGH